MFDREMMLTGLQKQRLLLQELIQDIETNLTGRMSAQKAKTLVENLKKLRAIKADYWAYRASLEQTGSRTEMRSDRKAMEWAIWVKLKGVDPQADGPASSTGIYADFT